MNNQILDTPCAAGARSTSFHPAVHSNRPEPTFALIRSRTSHTQNSSMWVSTRAWNRGKSSNMFFYRSPKNTKSMVEKGALSRPLPLVNSINCDPLSDHSKSKAQTTKVQQPCHTLQMPLAEINYSCHGGEEEKEGHQFFFTTGRKERFAQKSRNQVFRKTPEYPWANTL